MKQALSGAMFNIEEIILVLELFYFQSQGDATHNRIYTEVVKLLKPVSDPSRHQPQRFDRNGYRRLHRD